MLILVLAANTAYADFPRLASLLARDDYAPHQLAFRGDRLAFSNGIVLLGILSALLIIAFGGSTGALLPLYALSVFAAFTFSQSGMVAHWRRAARRRWRLKGVVNGVGATVTALVALFAAVTNFMNPNLPIVPGLPIGWGSWVVLVIVPLFIWMFRKVRQHYLEAEKLSALPPDAAALPDAQARRRRADLAAAPAERAGAAVRRVAVAQRHGRPRGDRRAPLRRDRGGLAGVGPGHPAGRSSNRRIAA